MANPKISFAETVTIASSGTASNAIDIAENGWQLAGFIIPAAFTGTSISLQTSNTLDGTYVTVQDGAGADLTFAVTVSRFIPIPNLSLTAGLRFLKVVSNATEASSRVIVLAARAIS